MRFDRKVYFDHVREELFGAAMSQENVDGQNVLLGLWESEATGTPMEDIRWLAYILASVYHETAHKMWPLEEFGQGSGYEYGKEDPETGQKYFGRGLIQITWRENYSKMSKLLSLVDDRDLEWHANVALDSLISARITFRGMAEGIFTGKKLGDYFNDAEDDPIGARAIVNDADRATEIAGYHAEFLIALERSQKPDWA